jgi:hypothetical protein
MSALFSRLEGLDHGSDHAKIEGVDAKRIAAVIDTFISAK